MVSLSDTSKSKHANEIIIKRKLLTIVVIFEMNKVNTSDLGTILDSRTLFLVSRDFYYERVGFVHISKIDRTHGIQSDTWFFNTGQIINM